MNIFDGVDIPEEAKAALQANLEEHTAKLVDRTELDKVIANRDEILAEKKAVQEREKQKEEEAQKALLEAQAAKGDVTGLKTSYEEKIQALEEKLNGYETEKKQTTLKSIASDFVSKNVVEDEFIRNAMTAEITKRLDVRDGQTVVFSPDGTLTAMKPEDLFNEIKSSSTYKPHIVGSKASGGSANGASASSTSGQNLAEKRISDAKNKEEKTAIIQARLDAAGL